MCQENTQVRYEFGAGRLIVGKVTPLDLEKIQLFLFILSPSQIDILN